MSRYFIVVLFMAAGGVWIVAQTVHIMFGEREYWHDVAERFVSDSLPLKPARGNILSHDGKLMASSLPEYRIYMDFLAGGYKKDTMLTNHMDEICRGLNRIFPDRSVAWFKNNLQQGRRKQSRNYLIYPRRISYIQYKEVKKLPVFRLNKNSGGFHEQAFNNRKKPFGSLAARTLGDLYADTAQGAKNGIELAFDSVLKGRYGMAHRQKVMNKYLTLTEVPPEDGSDVVTTLDVDMQDICEKALVDKLKEIDAAVGVAILMEVKTGEIKAIVNMGRADDGQYYEMRNYAISDMMEPGSTFKTASIMVALEDGKITPQTRVNTGNGQMKMYDRVMRDHNYNRGGYGDIDVTRILEVSSNIGVSYLIDKHYRDNPQQFVDGLKRMSIDQPLHLPIAGEGVPNIKGPKDGKYFAKTTLPWMSIGYETQLPPLNILTFYNAIANNGKMMRPLLVKEIVKNGEVIETFPAEVINKKICSDKTLTQIREILQKVVSEGLAKPAGNSQFPVAGKTGTAQISQGAAGYKSGKTMHLVSFCGYFPADNPQYSCIVSIQNPRIGYASGGVMAGGVFGKIAERVYAKNLSFDVSHATDSLAARQPAVKGGDSREAQLVLKELDLDDKAEAADATRKTVAMNIVPTLVGMGAKDAVYELERRGLKARLSGVGRVKSQSVQGGNRVVKGQTVTLELTH
ncbi:MAG: transpeptidase family protein [Prevotellaceae bacterium]|nr:transpeptidase family protein [Prevotellaceae bacterium]